MNRITAEGREVGVGRGDGSGAREDRSASVSEQRKIGAATVSSVHSVSHKDEHTWMHSEENLHYGGES